MKENTWYWDYPATAAICHDDACLVKRSSLSHYPEHKRWHSVLKSKLEEIADIGKSLVGNCAEQHAANIIYESALRKYPHRKALSQGNYTSVIGN